MKKKRGRPRKKPKTELEKFQEIVEMLVGKFTWK